MLSVKGFDVHEQEGWHPVDDGLEVPCGRDSAGAHLFEAHDFATAQALRLADLPALLLCITCLIGMD